MPFRSKNDLSGLELSHFRLEYPFESYPFGSRLIFWARMPLRARKIPFRPQIPSLGRDALAGLELPWAVNALLYCACPIRPITPL